MKTKVITILCLIVAIIIGCVAIPALNKGTRDTVSIPMLSKDISGGTYITEKNFSDYFSMTEVGKYGLSSDTVKTKKELLSKWVVDDLKENTTHYLYEKMFSSKEVKAGIIHKIKNGAVTVTTDLTKCVGGLPRPGDYVKIYVVTRNESTKMLESTLYKALMQVQILSIQNDNGADTQNQDKNSSAFSTGKEGIPKTVTFNTEYNLQEELITKGLYNGDIHLSLINPDSVDKSLIDIDPKRIPDIEKDGAKVISSTPIANITTQQQSNTVQGNQPTTNTPVPPSNKQSTGSAPSTNNGNGNFSKKGFDIQ